MMTIAQQIAQRKALHEWRDPSDADKNKYWITFFEQEKLNIIAVASTAATSDFYVSDDLYDNLRYNSDIRVFINENFQPDDIMRDPYMSEPFRVFYAWLNEQGCDCKFVITYDRSEDYIYVNLQVFTI